MPPQKPLSLALIGVGGVGQAFLLQLALLQSRLKSKLDIRLVLIRRSTAQILDSSWRGLDIKTAVQQLEDKSNGEGKGKLLGFEETCVHLATAPGHVVLVDCTSDPQIAGAYPGVLKKGISIVTPNKKAFSSSFSDWTAIFETAANGPNAGEREKGNGFIFHESTVGAGLPVLSTLTELIETGDEVTRIEGVFSGTMSFLFNSFNPVAGGGGSFSAEVGKAKELGYTEPDPRDDLNGLDVARKLTILARLTGLEIESPTSFPVQSLIPKELESCASADEFMEKLHEYDGRMDEVKGAAAKEGKVIRFVGSIDVGSKEVKVGLESFEKSHPIAALKGSDNIINFYTKRYGSNPLIIQGAGAGAEVTAMGVMGDLLRVIRLLR
ncbi:Homoserine dehydrogenase [Elasticomyces elasticus]|nr:Homoserine dehydrogenase [Elasticomyces elasticus]KAK4965095.1 Homoserine dehydrogenase [Elasticomyces elasticus]